MENYSPNFEQSLIEIGAIYHTCIAHFIIKIDYFGRRIIVNCAPFIKIIYFYHEEYYFYDVTLSLLQVYFFQLSHISQQ